MTDVLPGAELVAKGLADLARRDETAEAPPRLDRIDAARGDRHDVREPFAEPELRLFALLACDGPDAAHGRYNALVRRLVSYERAAERAAR